MVKGVPQHLIDAGNANRVIRAKRAERKKTMVTPCRKGFLGQVTSHFPIVWHGQSWVGFDILLLRYGCFIIIGAGAPCIQKTIFPRFSYWCSF